MKPRVRRVVLAHADFSACGPSQSRSQQFAWSRFLHEGNNPNVLWIRTGFEFQLNTLIEALALR